MSKSNQRLQPDRQLNPPTTLAVTGVCFSRCPRWLFSLSFFVFPPLSSLQAGPNNSKGRGGEGGGVVPMFAVLLHILPPRLGGVLGSLWMAKSCVGQTDPEPRYYCCFGCFERGGGRSRRSCSPGLPVTLRCDFVVREMRGTSPPNVWDKPTLGPDT